MGKSEPPKDPLTAPEREVLQLIAEGKTTKEIARIVSMSAKTAGLVRYSVRHGVIRP